MKASAYSEVLRLLARELAMSSGKNRVRKKQFDDIVREGSHLMETLSYSRP